MRSNVPVDVFAYLFRLYYYVWAVGVLSDAVALPFFTPTGGSDFWLVRWCILYPVRQRKKYIGSPVRRTSTSRPVPATQYERGIYSRCPDVVYHVYLF